MMMMIMPSYPMGTRDSFPGIKQPEREADHSPPSSAEIEIVWSYTCIPPYAIMTWCIIKYRVLFMAREQLYSVKLDYIQFLNSSQKFPIPVGMNGKPANRESPRIV
jgi:hypothetical protein